MHGSVAAISISARKGIPKSNRTSAELKEEWGIVGDAHAGNWHRQVSLLAMESIDTMRAKGLKVRPGAFAENITTQFITLPELAIGTLLRIGGTVLEITQIGKECHTRCAIYYKAGDCVMPREGIFARVLNGGVINVGDEVEVLPCAESVTVR
ncbi:MAG: MOSC domain-containing protein [Bacteroidia bacterium]|nr:MOSC domain-containing protein [Bacteroidia bacterium]